MISHSEWLMNTFNLRLISINILLSNYSIDTIFETHSKSVKKVSSFDDFILHTENGRI